MWGTSIQVQSTLGKGSIFWFAAPTILPDEKATINLNKKKYEQNVVEGVRCFNDLIMKRIASNKETINKKPMKDLERRILVVDDEQLNHIVISKFLSDIPNCRVERAFNGEEALRMIVGCFRAYDLILMDINMPVMDGIQAFSQIRTLIKDGKIGDVKVVAVTANGSASDKAYYIKMGMLDVWSKPLHRKEFLQKVQTLLEEKVSFGWNKAL